ncbi:MAG: hypothetical protein ACFFCO_09330 [Promethearchaeota archaeon]
MLESARRVITEQLEVLSRTVFPMNYIFSSTYEYATKNPTCAIIIAGKDGNKICFTRSFSVPSKVLKKEGAVVYQRRLYYVKWIKILDSYLVLVPDQLVLPSADNPRENLDYFAKAVEPYLAAFDDILQRRFATIVIRLETRPEPIVLHRQATKGKQILTLAELLAEKKFSDETAQIIQAVFFQSKPSIIDERKRGRRAPKLVSAAFLTLEDGRVVLPAKGTVQVREYVELGKIPYYFEDVEGAVPHKEIITNFLQLENQSIARLLEESSQLAFMPFFFDLYTKHGGPPIRHVALYDGRLIIGRTPESRPRKGEFEVFIAKEGITSYFPSKPT